MTTGDVNINIIDGGAAVLLPAAQIQVVIGCTSGGVVAQPFATNDANILSSTVGFGKATEVAALAIQAGGTVIFCKANADTPGVAHPVQVHRFNVSTSVMTVTGTPLDDYYVQVNVVKGGVIGTTGIIIQVSGDAARHFGPQIALGTASTLAIPNTGITLNFGAGTLDAGDIFRFYTTAPLCLVSSVEACFAALKASPFALAGWGSMNLASVFVGSDTQILGNDMDTFFTNNYIFNRLMTESRDASPPVLWGGSGETEAAWMSAVQLDFSALQSKRICPNAGFYNMTTAYRNPIWGTSTYRRNLNAALAARQVTIPPQRHAGKVLDGQLAQIIVNPTVDPNDGFVYHDERVTPGFDAARMSSARTRIGLGNGFYIVNPNLASPPGSIFTILPLGNVMDNACAIVHQVGQQDINSDLRVNNDGTIVDKDAKFIENRMYGFIKVNMIDTGEISSATVVVNRSWNVLATNILKVAVTITGRGYVLTENVDVMYQNPFGG